MGKLAGIVVVFVVAWVFAETMVGILPQRVTTHREMAVVVVAVEAEIPQMILTHLRMHAVRQVVVGFVALESALRSAVA